MRKLYKRVCWKAGATARRHNSVPAYSPKSFSRKRTHRFFSAQINDEVKARVPINQEPVP